jgi:hypothetical protein
MDNVHNGANMKQKCKSARLNYIYILTREFVNEEIKMRLHGKCDANLVDCILKIILIRILWLALQEYKQ